MDEENNTDAKPEKTDPRLKSFLRKASAIIASERGLNVASRLKLQTLADRESLPSDLFEQALEKLQAKESFSNLSRYEKSFVEFLEDEFGKLAGGVLSPAAEKKAIQLAETKYQINGTRAEQLIQIQADSSGIARISSDDGLAFADSFIVEKIGTSEVVDEEMQEEIYQVGQKWGIGQKQVEQIIARQIKANRSLRKSKALSKVLPWLALILLSGTLGVLGTLAYQENWFAGEAVVTSPVEAPIDTPPNEFELKWPWLSRTAQTDLASLSKNNDKLKRIFEDLSAENPDEHENGIQALVTWICTSEVSEKERTLELAAETIHQFPGTAAISSIEFLEQFLLLASDKPTTVKQLKDCYRANSLLNELMFTHVSDDPSAVSKKLKQATNRLAQIVSNVETEALASSIDRTSFRKISDAEIASKQWSDLIQKSWTNPVESARLVQPLLEITKARLAPESLDQFRNEALLSILGINIERWTELKTPMSVSIETCDESTLMKWLSLFVEADNQPFQNHVGPQLAKRLQLKPRSHRAEEIVKAVKKYEFQFRYRQFQPIFDRNELLDRLVNEINEKEPTAEKEIVSPDRIAQVALAINVELSFCNAIENATRLDSSVFSEFDRMISLPAPRLRELVSLPSDRDRQKSDLNEQSTAMASDRRRLESAINRLSDLSEGTAGLRRLALKQLERVAHRFKAIPYRDAKILATYFLSNSSIEERLEIEKQIESFSHWPNLALAIADELPNSQLKQPSTVGMIRSLTGLELEDLDSDEWRQDLHRKMMLSVVSGLGAYIDRDPDNTWSDWSRLKIYLTDIYRERLMISTGNQTTSGQYDDPIEPNIELLLFIADTTPNARELNLERATSLVRSISDNPITQTQCCEQLLIRAFASQLADSDFRLDSERILAGLKNSSMPQKSKPAGNRLLETEQLLLKMVDLKRRWLVAQLVNGGRR